jgi:hypothetical protein
MDYVSRQFVVLAKKFRKELRKTNESLHRDLVRLSDRLKNLIETTKAKGEPQDKRDQAITVAVTEFRTHIPISIEKNVSKTGPERIWAIVKGAFEIGVAVAVIAYTGISFENWQEQIAATNFAGIQTKKAREALNETTKNFQLDQRPWVGVSDNRIEQWGKEKDYVIEILIVNSGKSPALETWYWNKGTFGPNPGANPAFMDDGTKRVQVGAIPPAGSTKNAIELEVDRMEDRLSLPEGPKRIPY